MPQSLLEQRFLARDICLVLVKINNTLQLAESITLESALKRKRKGALLVQVFVKSICIYLGRVRVGHLWLSRFFVRACKFSPLASFSFLLLSGLCSVFCFKLIKSDDLCLIVGLKHFHSKSKNKEKHWCETYVDDKMLRWRLEKSLQNHGVDSWCRLFDSRWISWLLIVYFDILRFCQRCEKRRN